MVYKIFQMDYNWNTKEYRMLLDFFYLKYATFFLHFKPPHVINPKEFLDRPTATRGISQFVIVYQILKLR